MTDFYVNGMDMQLLSNQVGRVREALTAGADYARRYAHLTLLSGKEGLITGAISSNDDVYRDMTGAVSALHDWAEGLGKWINETQTRYGEVDLHSANALAELAAADATVVVPADPAPLAGLAYPHGPYWKPFFDVISPTARYVLPAPTTDDHAWHYSVWTDGLSPSGFVRWYIQQAFHVDIFFEVTKYLAGDWTAYIRAGTVWSNLGLACGDMAANATRAAADTPSIWGGHAAEACQELLVGYAGVLTTMADECPAYTKLYQDISQAAMDADAALNDILEQICDWVLYTVGLTAAAAATEETVVGTFAFGGAAGVAAARVALLISRTFDTMAHFTSTVGKIAATISLLSLGTDKLPPLPHD